MYLRLVQEQILGDDITDDRTESVAVTCRDNS